MYVILLIASRRRLSINMKQFFIGVWQFISYPLAELSQCILDSSNGSIINVI